MEQTPPSIQPTTVRCVRCGYDLSGATIGGMCSECGASVSETFEARAGDKSSSTATACMVLGILSLVVCQLLGPVAIALYYRAEREMAGGGYASVAQSMAKAGLILGIISTILLIPLAMCMGLSMLGPFI